MLENEISRRTLLKVIAAGCGVVVASSLPREWVKPVIDAGMLPVHAQTTSGGTITGFLRNCGLAYWPDIVTVDGLGLSSGPSSSPDGAFIITGVPAGTYNLTCVATGGTASGVTVTVGTTTSGVIVDQTDMC
jgi:hypothetical protein